MLAPTAIAVAYIGGWLFLGLCTLAAGIILWEWTSIVFRSLDARVFALGVAVLLVAMALTCEGRVGAAIATLAIGAALAGVLVLAWPRRNPGSNPAGWAAGGVVYAGIGLLAPALLRTDPQLGFVAIVFLFAIVWATDIFAYLVGRAGRRAVALAGGQPEKDLVGCGWRPCRGGCRRHGGRLCERWNGVPPWRLLWHRCFQLLRKAVIYSNPRSSGDLARKTQAALFRATAA